MQPEYNPVPAFIKLLKSEQVEYRREAAHNLRLCVFRDLWLGSRSPQAGDDKIIEALFAALRSDGDLHVRDDEAVSLYVMRVIDEHLTLETALALAEQGEFASLSNAISPGTPSFLPREHTIEALRLVGERAVPGLGRFLTDERRLSARVYAASALGLLGYKSAVPALILALKDTDFQVRTAAIISLGQLRDPIAIPALEELIQNDHGLDYWNDRPMRELAEKAIAKINDKM